MFFYLGKPFTIFTAHRYQNIFSDLLKIDERVPESTFRSQLNIFKKLISANNFWQKKINFHGFA